MRGERDLSPSQVRFLHKPRARGNIARLGNSANHCRAFECGVLRPLHSDQATLRETIYAQATLMRTHIRCIVKSMWTDWRGRTLFCTECGTEAVVRVILHDLWADMHVDCGNVVHVHGPFADGSPPPRVVVSAASGMLVVNPDVLVPVSEVAHACRRTWPPHIADALCAGFGPVHPSTGVIVHELLLQALADPAFHPTSAPQYMRTALADNSARVAQNGHTDEEVLSQLGLFPDACAKFLRIFQDRGGEGPRRRGGLKCVDVNEEVSSHRYGLVGFPDVTVDFTVDSAAGVGSAVCIGPLDIKAGRPRPEDETQVTLYALILADKYRSEPSASLLYYAQAARLVRVDFVRHVALEAVKTRNSLAALHVLRRRNLDHWTGPLPTVCLNSQGDGQDAMDLKFLVALNYRAAAVAGTHEATSLRKARIETARISDYECQYFAGLSRAVALEEGATEKAHVELWTTPALKREAGGKTLAELILVGGALSPASARGWANRYTFVRRVATGSFLEGPFSPGDAVVISVEPDLHAVARGIVRQVLPDRLTVSAFKPLDVDGVLLSTRRIRDGVLVFTLDRDESAAGPERTIRHNLVRLFGKGQQKLRRLVVRLQSPVFTPGVPSNPSQALNAGQQAAVEMVLAAEDYALIRALPGTGITRTVTQCIRRLVEAGKSVLLASHSNAVLDTTLCALDGAPFEVLRLGKAGKMHPNAKKYSLGGGAQGTPQSADEYKRRLHEPAVVAITCLSVKDSVFCGRTFDVCIVPDASRVTMPTCLGPLLHAKAFVLVGDERQLGPIIHTPSAYRDGLAETLFERLSKAHPGAIAHLTLQYRMSSAVMTPSNDLSYDGQLVCASAQVSQNVLRLPFKAQCPLEECWLDWVLGQRCTFVDADGLFSTRSRGGPNQDEVEAWLIDKVCGALTSSGVDERKIGVLAYYRNHVQVLRRALWRYPDVDVRTVDSLHGEVKDCMLLYVARIKAADQAEPKFLADAQRMTTALTQARCKLVVVGSRRALGAVPTIRRLLDLFDGHGWSIAPTRDPVEHRHGPPHSLATQGLGPGASPTRHGAKRHRSVETEHPRKRTTFEVNSEAVVVASSFPL